MTTDFNEIITYLVWIFVGSIYFLNLIRMITHIIVSTRIDVLNQRSLQNYHDFEKVMISINSQIHQFNANFAKAEKLYKQMEEKANGLKNES
jgi:tRNA(Phe) wybutosine-synthesizing methylase Tyw3